MKHKTSPARNASLCLLEAVMLRGLEMDAACDTTPEFKALEGRNRQFAYLLTMTTLRHMGRLNALLASWLESPLPAKYKPVQLMIVLGFAQIFVLNTPAHAAVNETVELAKHRFKSHVKLINALLQRAVREGKDAFNAIPMTANLPAWLRERWQQHYPEELDAIAVSLADEPPLDLTYFKAPPPEGKILPNGTLRREFSPIQEIDGYADGHFQVQDVSAALPVALFSTLAGKTLLDMCAAPGGKAAQAAHLGAQVTALDISANRMKRLQENLTRVHVNATTIVTPAQAYNPETLFDCVLLDAPCSSTGTLRRNPDLAWRRESAALERLVELQRNLVVHALECLKSGGELVYSVCSMEPEEGEAQIEWLLNEHKNVTLAFDVPHMPIRPKAASPFGLRFLPTDLGEHGGMDGFFMTRMVKQ